VTWQWVTVILGLAFLTFSFFGFALMVIGKPAGSNDPAPRRDPSTEETQVIKR
jgi:hypothetical protein